MERDPMTVEQFVTILWMGGIITAGICIWSTRTSWLPWFKYVGDLLAYWWQQEIARAERKAQERVTRKSQPLVAIHVSNRYQEHMSSDEEDTAGTISDGTPDNNQLEPPDTSPGITSMVPDLESGIRLVAAIRLTDGTYLLSANKIADGVKMNRNEALKIIAEIRNEPPKPDGPEFTKNGPRQNFVRTGVKPLR